MDRAGAEALDSTHTWWAPAVRAPHRDWPGMPGCRSGARFLIDEHSRRPARDNYPVFETRTQCLEWIMAHRAELVRTAPGAAVMPVSLQRWLLGLE
ncbi:hypothetical protein [Sphingosinicella sp. YJ22]|uniref:hypothetical protein n=1 Tax=Sphingosinicella sp. YJ22 TaxID=1104780 RepID=UPI00140DA5A3|nr:hypothetical protein [Sphingosinicella sp. YJ22]